MLFRFLRLSCLCIFLVPMQNGFAEEAVAEYRSLRAIFLEDADSTTHYIKLAAPNSINNDYSLVLPDVAGMNGEILQSDGNGALSWGPPPLLSPLSNTGDMIYSVGSTATRLPGSTSTTKQFLTQTGLGGGTSAAPAWGTIASSDLPAASSIAAGSVSNEDNGSFQINLSGPRTITNQVVYYSRVGKIVSLYIPANNTTACTVSTQFFGSAQIGASLRPAFDVYVPIFIRNASTAPADPGILSINSSGDVQIQGGPLTNFSATGSCGWYNASVTYIAQ